MKRRKAPPRRAAREPQLPTDETKALEKELDDALKDTFPASDPVAVDSAAVSQARSVSLQPAFTSSLRSQVSGTEIRAPHMLVVVQLRGRPFEGDLARLQHVSIAR